MALRNPLALLALLLLAGVACCLACPWTSHCQGDPCRTYDDCYGSLTCISGHCASGTPQPTPKPTSGPTKPTPAPTKPTPAPTNPTPAPTSGGAVVGRFIWPRDWDNGDGGHGQEGHAPSGMNLAIAFTGEISPSSAVSLASCSCRAAPPSSTPWVVVTPPVPGLWPASLRSTQPSAAAWAVRSRGTPASATISRRALPACPQPSKPPSSWPSPRASLSWSPSATRRRTESVTPRLSSCLSCWSAPTSTSWSRSCTAGAGSTTSRPLQAPCPGAPGAPARPSWSPSSPTPTTPRSCRKRRRCLLQSGASSEASYSGSEQQHAQRRQRYQHWLQNAWHMSSCRLPGPGRI